MMAYRKNFSKDLTWGEKWERVVGLYLSLDGVEDISFNKDNRWDIMGYENNIEVKYEVKADKYEKTGNMAIEIRDNGKPSGISVSQANVFIYLFTNISKDFIYMYFIGLDKLKKLIKSNIKDMKIVKGGDNDESQMILIPMKKYQSEFDLVKLSKNKH